MDGYSAETEARTVVCSIRSGESDRGRYAAFEATELGHGGIAYISQFFKCDANPHVTRASEGFPLENVEAAKHY